MSARFLALLSLLLVFQHAASTLTVERIANTASPATLAAAHADLGPASHVVPFIGTTARRASRRTYLSALRKGVAGKNYTTVLAGADNDEEYLADLTVGGQKFRAIVDTGSSDTWVVKKGFKCFNLTSYPEPTADCAFGTTFDPAKSKTYKPYPAHNFNISYGDGEFLTGTAAFETVSLGGPSVPKQEIGVVDHAAWNGDGVNSGLLGLAYPTLTSVYNGSDPTLDGRNTSAPYNPLLFTALAQGSLAQPIFSIALNRGSPAARANSSYDPHLGLLGLGGIAPVPVTSRAVTVPVQSFQLRSRNATAYEFYAVEVGKYVFPGSKAFAMNGSTILDSGTTLNYLPTKVARAYNAAFKPAATYNEDYGLYYVACDARAPAFSVVIGGQTFAVDPRDNVIPSGTDDDGKKVCISGTQDGGRAEDDNVFILGDVFLHNVVATFNLKANTIHLAERKAY